MSTAKISKYTRHTRNGITIGYMAPEDIVVGLKVRLIVNLTDLPAGSIGVVAQVADTPWRFWLCWPLTGRNRYSLAFEAAGLRHFEIVQECMTEAACAAVNSQLADAAKPSGRGRKVIVEQLRLPLSED
jgi:hypothetical protein